MKGSFDERGLEGVMTAAGIGIFALSAGKWPGNTFFCLSYKYNLTPEGSFFSSKGEIHQRWK